MPTKNFARFTINGTPSEDANGKRGYDTSAGSELTITLETNPAIGVLTIAYDVNDPTKASSPLNSLYASELVITENGGKSYVSSNPNTTIHITIPQTADISSYTIRATAITATGSQVFERIICIRKSGLRLTIPAETLQYVQRGWTDAINELTKVIADGGVSFLSVSSSQTGIISAFPTSRRIFHSDGNTEGGIWTALSKQDVDASFVSASIDFSKLAPGTEGSILRTTSGSVAWGTDVTLVRPSDPGQNGYVATGLNGDLNYILIGNSQISSDAQIAVTKLAKGASGSVLATVGLTVQWTALNLLSKPKSPTDNDKVALASNGNLVYGYIGNNQIASNAQIAITKLAPGTEGSVLKIISGVVSWATEGGGEVNLPASPGDNGKVAFGKNGNLDYADGVVILNVDTSQNAISTCGVFLPSINQAMSVSNNELILWNRDGILRLSNSTYLLDVLTGIQPAFPADSNKVAILGEYGYDAAFISDANIGTNAAITISKLRIGNEGQYIKTANGSAIWSSINGFDIIANSIMPIALNAGSANTVLLSSSGGVTTWDSIKNENVASNASVSVSKLALGTNHTVLSSNGTGNSWTNHPTVEACTAVLYLDTTGFLWLHHASTEPPNPAAWGCNLYADINVLKSKFNDNTIWEIASQAISV